MKALFRGGIADGKELEVHPDQTAILVCPDQHPILSEVEATSLKVLAAQLYYRQTLTGDNGLPRHEFHLAGWTPGEE